MNGIQYITNRKGKTTGVLLDLRKVGDFWEDFYDAWVAKYRKNDDDWVSWEEVKRELRALDAREAKARKKPLKSRKK